MELGVMHWWRDIGDELLEARESLQHPLDAGLPQRVHSALARELQELETMRRPRHQLLRLAVDHQQLGDHHTAAIPRSSAGGAADRSAKMARVAFLERPRDLRWNLRRGNRNAAFSAQATNEALRDDRAQR